MRSLRGQTVWITGASSGIGEALAFECFDRGARLVLSARNEERLSALRRLLVDSLQARHPRGSAPRRTAASSDDLDHTCKPTVLIQPLDLTHEEQIWAVVESVRKEVGRIDILVHVAGVSQRALGADTKTAVLRTIMETNFFGPVALTQALLSSMTEGDGARLVVITSAFGKFGAPGRSAYAASKHALHGYFDSLRAELPPEAVGITLVVPGAIATNISANALKEDGSPHGEMDVGIARGLSPQQCARRIVRAVLAGRDEVLVAPGLLIRLALLMKVIAPRLLTRILRRIRIT